MRKSIVEIAREAGGISDMECFWSLIHGQLEARGVSSILFGVLASRRELEQRRLSQALIWKSSHSQSFFDAFDLPTLFDNDVTAQHCVEASEIMLWHDPKNWQDATPAQIRRAGIERDLGLAVGFTVPSAHFFPNQVGGVGVSTADVPLREFDRFWKQEGRDLVTLCGLLDSGMRGQHLGALVDLSPREEECLTYLASGLRAARIAEKMKVGTKQVEKYVQAARKKLRATTRDHAVAKGVMLGIITP